MPEPTTIFRPALPEDAPAIRALVRSAYAKWVPLIGREPLPMTADYVHAVEMHEFDLALRDGELAALIETRQEPDHLWIENLAVSPAHQGQGLGSQLLVRAEAKAAARGLQECRLLTNGAFEANVALYLRRGYIVDEREPFMGGITVHMSKRLVR